MKNPRIGRGNIEPNFANDVGPSARIFKAFAKWEISRAFEGLKVSQERRRKNTLKQPELDGLPISSIPQHRIGRESAREKQAGNARNL